MTLSLTALIEKLEQAAEGSRELDCYIHALLHPDQRVMFDPGDLRERRAAEWGRLADFALDGWGDYEDVAREIGAPPYTTSVDAARSLLPGYHKWVVGSEWAAVWQEDGRLADAEKIATKNRPALALCIAALKARQS